MENEEDALLMMLELHPGSGHLVVELKSPPIERADRLERIGEVSLVAAAPKAHEPS